MRPLVVQEGSQAHWALRVGVVAVGAFVALGLPLLATSASEVNDFSQIALYAVAILGLSLVTGYCGQISLGQSAFFGVGGYTTLILVTKEHWPYLATIPVSAAICLVFGALVGIPALRIRGLYLATVTLAIAAAFPSLVDKFSSLTGGTTGLFASNNMEVVKWFLVTPTSPTGPAVEYYLVTLAIAVVMFLIARNIVRSRVGRAMVAVRDSPVSASSAGVSVAATKIFAFAVGAAFAGVAGSLLAIELPTATDSQYSLLLAIYLLVGLITGGSGTLTGAIPGAVVFVGLNSWLANWLEGFAVFNNGPKGGEVVSLVSGALLLLFVFVLPGGVVEGLRRVAHRLVVVDRRPPADWEQYRLVAADGGVPATAPTPAPRRELVTAAPEVPSISEQKG